MNLKNRLEVFAKWLSDYEENSYDSYREGQIESMIRYAQDSTIQKVGAMLQEILDYDENSEEWFEAKIEANVIDKNKLTYD
jgi:hypothetical protein